MKPHNLSILILALILLISCQEQTNTATEETTPTDKIVGEWTFTVDSVQVKEILIYNIPTQAFLIQTQSGDSTSASEPVKLRKIGRKYAIKKRSGFDSYTINPDGTLTWRQQSLPLIIGRGKVDFEALWQYNNQ